MSLDNHQQPRSDSPALSSGRNSPAPGRQPRRQLDDDNRKQDKTYRRYAAQVERALAGFDTGHLEWPDYISCLGRLLKAIQTHPPVVETVPHSTAVASKLSQCLSPSLPSGVHSKTLEVYDTIFSLVGAVGLARDLPIFLPGLSSVLTFASLSIRPLYLSLLEGHILALPPPALRPALKALVLSILPGLEDETSEDFERTFNLLNRLKVAVNSAASKGPTDSTGFGDEFFWQCLFLASIGGRSSRQGAYSYLVRCLPKLGPEPGNGDPSALSVAAESVISPEPGLLIRCFAAGLEDEQPLLQRGFLDLLLSHLPLNSPVLVDRVDALDLQRLMTAAISVVARRDMSLNRRLWTWFLGPELPDAEAEEKQAMNPLSPTTPSAISSQNLNSKALKFFKRFGSDALVKCVQSQFTEGKSIVSEKARPFRTCLSLMDRWEVGSILVPNIFALSLDNLMTYRVSATEAEFAEALRSASSFFDAVESGVIWGEIVALIESALSTTPLAKESRLRKLELVSFIIKHFNTREEDMIAFHIPLSCLFILAQVVGDTAASQSLPLSRDQATLSRAVSLVDQLVSVIPERAQLNRSFGDAGPTLDQTNDSIRQDIICDRIRSFYLEQHGELSDSPPPFNSFATAMMILNLSALVLYSGLRMNLEPNQLETRAHIVSNLATKLPSCESLELDSLIFQLMSVLSDNMSIPFPTLLSIGQVLTHVVPKLSGSEDPPAHLLELISELVTKLWDFLTPASPKYHVEAVRTLWALDNISPNDAILESSVARFLADGATRRAVDSIDVEPARRFSVLWSHSLPYFGASKRVTMFSKREGGYSSAYITGMDDAKDELALHRPLLLFLDSLEEEETENHYFLVNWLGTMGNLYTIFDVILSRLAKILIQRDKNMDPGVSPEQARLKCLHEDATRQCLYYLQHLSNLLKLSGDQLWAVLAEGISIPSLKEDSEEETSIETIIARLAIRLLESELVNSSISGREISSSIICSSLRVLKQLLRNPEPNRLREAALEERLVNFIERVTYKGDLGASVQVALLETTLAYLQLKYDQASTISRPKSHRRSSSLETLQPPSQSRLANMDSKEFARPISSQTAPPPKRLIKCLQDGIKSPSSHYVLENWIAFLVDVLPLYADTLFQNLIPLVETFCKQISLNFDQLRLVFEKGQCPTNVMSESSLISLLNGLEHLLALSHDRLAAEESSGASTKLHERNQGFFGNVVSGVFTSEVARMGGNAANSRLTVILSLQDAVRSCFAIWTWGVQGPSEDARDATCIASYGYIASKLRNRARRLLDRMFMVEPLECLETLIAHGNGELRKQSGGSHVNHLLNALDGSRPKRIMPSIFNSLYSRTNPSALETNQISSLTNDVKDYEIGTFLIEYTKSLDDDAMDEIWQDCMTFLKDVLSNPLVHSSILPSLLLFLVSLAEKIEHTNFGEQRKMRKDIGDIFLRLLAATFTARPHQVIQELSDGDATGNRPPLGEKKDSIMDVAASRPKSIVDIIATVVPRLPMVLPENERLNSAISNISTNVIGPVIHTKSFPEPMQPAFTGLVQRVMKISSASKTWRKDIGEMFTHAKLFSCKRKWVEPGLMPIFRHWSSTEKDRLPETFGRIAAPTSAGIMFGVGASAARLEADKKTQLGLRRTALLILSMENDSVVPSLQGLEEKLVELLGATPASSPTSMTRAEVFMVIQAIVLKTSAIHLASLWPIVTAELEKAIGSAVTSSKDFETFNVTSLMQACKLLDLLILIGPDGFQAHEWIFITDTIDAVYRPPGWEPTGLVDELAEELGAAENGVQSPNVVAAMDGTTSRSMKKRRPLLRVEGSVAEMSKEEFVKKVLKPFFMQLSIHSFEGTYSMREPDMSGCRAGVLDDLFDDSTIVG